MLVRLSLTGLTALLLASIVRLTAFSEPIATESSNQIPTITFGAVDPQTELSYGVGLLKATYKPGERIQIFIGIKNKGSAPASALHSRPEILISRSDGSTRADDFHFSVDERQTGSFYSGMYVIDPDRESYSGVTLNREGNEEELGSYRVTLQMNLLKSPADATIVKPIPPQVVTLTIAP